MGIQLDEISVLEAVLNEKFSGERLSFKMSVHFVKDRMNDPRNNPNITFTELQGIFNRLTTIHISKLIRLNHHDTFNVRCSKSDINIPCAVEMSKDTTGNGCILIFMANNYFEVAVIACHPRRQMGDMSQLATLSIHSVQVILLVNQ